MTHDVHAGEHRESIVATHTFVGRRVDFPSVVETPETRGHDAIVNQRIKRREEISALLQFWRYVGHLLGVQPRWYPATPEEGIGLLYASEIKGVRRSGEDGRLLAESYLASFRPTPTDSKRDALIKKLEHGLERGYAAWFLPPQSHYAYKLRGPGLWALHPPAQFLPRYALETVRRRVPRVDEWVDRRARAKSKAWVHGRLGERHAEYQAVSNFTR